MKKKTLASSSETFWWLVCKNGTRLTVHFGRLFGIRQVLMLRLQEFRPRPLSEITPRESFVGHYCIHCITIKFPGITETNFESCGTCFHLIA